MNISLTAIVLAESPASQRCIAGLSLAERGARVAQRVGAGEVIMVTSPGERAALAALRPRARRVLVLRVSDQLVHPPLVEPLLAGDTAAVAVAPPRALATDLAEGAYAGALVSDRVEETLAALAAGRTDAELAAGLLAGGAAARPHGELARHPATTEDERRGAEALLYRTLVKPQDNVIARALFRPLSTALTRALVATPITPNQVTTVTLLLVALGLWLVAKPGTGSVAAGSAVILLANYVDCCDGEIARLKLCSSRLGAWYDTIVDEAASFGYMLAIGWHCHLALAPAPAPGAALDPTLPALAVGATAYLISLYCVYFNIIVVARSANSQDYVSRVELARGTDGTWALRPVPQRPMELPASWPRPVAAAVSWLPNVIRRDFIVFAALVLVVLGLPHVVFAAMVLGGVVTAAVVSVDHLLLRLQLGELRERAELADA